MFHGFDMVVKKIWQSCSTYSRPLQNKTKLRFDQDFRACWSFCFQLKALSQSSHCLPWVCCAFGNIFIWATDFNKSTQPLTTWNLSRCIIRNTYIFTTNVLICIGGGIKPMKRTRVHTFTYVKQEHTVSSFLNPRVCCLGDGDFLYIDIYPPKWVWPPWPPLNAGTSRVAPFPPGIRHLRN